ncbi:hypothetical protein H2201_006637 [Coniosporium apollinis]|uniref:Cytochrome b5 heme-binding domain-containing protein n=1 Tax=Coniosporium apollinis TaxID=61459 RepID=A0ABQ9NL76_9PEZI|nr:hypothetical protein H2201_006637 [Coniosporium apollinis]
MAELALAAGIASLVSGALTVSTQLHKLHTDFRDAGDEFEVFSWEFSTFATAWTAVQPVVEYRGDEISDELWENLERICGDTTKIVKKIETSLQRFQRRDEPRRMRPTLGHALALFCFPRTLEDDRKAYRRQRVRKYFQRSQLVLQRQQLEYAKNSLMFIFVVINVTSHGSVHTVIDILSERWMSPPLPGGSELSRHQRYSPQAEVANELHDLRTQNAALRAKDIERGRELHQARVEHSDAMDQLQGQIVHLRLERKRFEDLAHKEGERCAEVERHNARMFQNLRRVDDEFKGLQMRYDEVVEEYKRMRSERDRSVGQGSVAWSLLGAKRGDRKEALDDRKTDTEHEGGNADAPRIALSAGGNEKTATGSIRSSSIPGSTMSPERGTASPQTTPKASAVNGAPIPSFSLASSDPADSEDEEDKDVAPAFPALNSAQRASAPPTMSPRSPSVQKPPPQPAAARLMPPPPRLPPTPRMGQSTAASLRVPTTGPLPNRGPPKSTTGSTLGIPSSGVIKPTNGRERQKVNLGPGYSPLDWATLLKSGKNLSGVTGFQRVTPSQLKSMNGRKGRPAWSSYQGKVYNITPYLPYHPGGEGELRRAAGKDGAKLFMEVHPWVNWENMMGECLVGILVSEESGGGSPLEDMD